MSAIISILDPGFYTTVQDGGRFGYAHLGVPESGAMDLDAFRLANALLNNDFNAAMLECTLVGPRMLLSQDCYIVITGASCDPKLDNIAIAFGVPVLARTGQTLSLSKITQGTRAYIAFAGGLKVPMVLGSRSWYPSVTRESHLKKGMTMALGISTYSKSKGAHLKVFQPYDKKHIHCLKVFPGPEYNYLTDAQKEKLKSSFTVSHLWNRMAVQLKEPLVNQLKSIKTSPVVPGTVQLTPSGKLIVLMRDCQTTGGYPRVLQLNGDAQNRLEQLSQSDQLIFEINSIS